MCHMQKIKKCCTAILACTKKQVHTRNDTKVLLTIDIHDDLICMRNASKMIFVYFLFRFFGMICFFYKNIYSPLFSYRRTNIWAIKSWKLPKSLSILRVTRKNILKHKKDVFCRCTWCMNWWMGAFVYDKSKGFSNSHA